MPHVGLFPKEFASPGAFTSKKNLYSPSISLGSFILLSDNLCFLKSNLIVCTNKMPVFVCPLCLSHRDGIFCHQLEILWELWFCLFNSLSTMNNPAPHLKRHSMDAFWWIHSFIERTLSILDISSGLSLMKNWRSSSCSQSSASWIEPLPQVLTDIREMDILAAAWQPCVEPRPKTTCYLRCYHYIPRRQMGKELASGKAQNQGDLL